MNRFEELTRSHNRLEFDCGVQELNDFLHSLAHQNFKKGLKTLQKMYVEVFRCQVPDTDSIEVKNCGIKGLTGGSRSVPFLSKKVPGVSCFLYVGKRGLMVVG